MSFIVIIDQLRQVAPEVPITVAVDDLNAAMDEFEVSSSYKRIAAFVAQTCYESDRFRCFVERWGPTVDQERYEMNPRLGNVLAGDGFLFRGRGAIQLTGRSNYQLCGDALGINLIDNPDMAASSPLVYRVAGWYWQKHGLNILADASDIVGITRAINGIGMYGLETRKAMYQAALKVFGA